MQKQQVEAFLSGLGKIELRNPQHVEVYGPLWNCIFMFNIPDSAIIELRPLCGIQHESDLWQEILDLFRQVTAR